MDTEAKLDVAEYSEDGERFWVDVLADNSDAEWHKFDLRQHETNETFSVSWKKKGGYCGGMWRLRFEDGRVVP